MSDSDPFGSGGRKTSAAINAILLKVVWSIAGFLALALLSVCVYNYQGLVGTVKDLGAVQERAKSEMEGYKLERDLLRAKLNSIENRLDRVVLILERVAAKDGIVAIP